MVKIALLTCSSLTGYHTDDSLFYEELQKHKVEAKWCVWDEPQDWSRFDLAIVRTTWDYTKKLEQFLNVLETIEGSGCRLYNSLSVIRWNTSKKYLFDLKDKGLPVLPIEMFSQNGFQELFNYWSCDKLVCKPLVGATAEGIQIISREEAVPQKTVPTFVQPFIESVYEGELSFHFFNNEYSHAVRKIPKQGDFRVQEEHGGSTVSYQASIEEIKGASQFLLDKYLYARVDMLNYRGGLQLIELELVEPALYFSHDLRSARNFVDAILTRL